MSGFDKNLLAAYPGLKGMDRFPILDDHMHLDPKGLGERVLGDFERAGGTHAMLVHKPYQEHPVSKAGDFEDGFRETLKLARRARERTNVKVLVAVGPYPVNLIRLEEKHGLKEAVDIMKSGMERAAEMVAEGEANAIGEIGRPHFPVSGEIMEASNEILSLGLRLAREVGCPVHLHTESGGRELFSELAGMARETGCPLSKVVKHFSGPAVSEEENCGLFPSVLASRRNVEGALAKGTRFCMETDYIDDLKRPGAVMVPKSIPKRTFQMIGKGLLTEKGAWAIHGEWPERIYGVEFDL